MSTEERRGPLARVVEAVGVADVVERLAGLRSADLATLLLEVARRQAGRRSAAQVREAYETSRFTAPGALPAAELRRVEAIVREALPADAEEVVLSPLLPLGAHGSVAAVDQNRVVSTVRATEVAADPTNGLALEAAVRRRRLLAADPRSAVPVTLAASQRVVRAQAIEGDGLYAHFHLVGLLTAGRDGGDLAFERDAVVEHVRFATRAARGAGATSVVVVLTDLTGGARGRVADGVRDALADEPGTEVVDDPDRPVGRDYYDGLCFKVLAAFGGPLVDVGDGGIVDWTQSLVASRKERAVISGVGVERLAAVIGA